MWLIPGLGQGKDESEILCGSNLLKEGRSQPKRLLKAKVTSQSKVYIHDPGYYSKISGEERTHPHITITSSKHRRKRKSQA